MPDGRRRSREGWADSMEAGPASPPAHVHRLPFAVRAAIVGLCGAVFLLLIGLGLMAIYVYQANQYVKGRGEFRDREATRMEQQSEEQIRRAMCDLLDTLPEGGLLDRPRGKYGCGPGIPLRDLPPEQAEQLREQRAPAAVAPAPSSAPAPAPALRDGADPTGPAPLPQSTPAPEPAPPTTSTEPPSLLDLEPYTGPLCESVRVCF